MNDDGRASIIRTALLGVLLCGGLIAADLLTKLTASKLGSREVVLIPGVLSLSSADRDFSSDDCCCS